MSNLQPVPSPAQLLPPEIWQHIFGYLSLPDLRNALLVCHDWLQLIVGTRSLIDQFRVRFAGLTKLDHRACNGFRFIPARLVCFVQKKIASVDGWWPGDSLTDVRMFECQVPVPTLLEMLRKAPNLERLTLDNVLYLEIEGAVEADFELSRLKELSLRRTFAPRIVDILRPACSVLESFEFTKGRPVVIREVIERLVQKVQGTLIKLDVPVTNEVVCALLEMDQLKLREVALRRVETDLVLEFCRKHPTLHTLNIQLCRAKMSHLREIGRLLPNLKHLRITYPNLQNLRNLVAMLKLETLTLADHIRIRWQVTLSHDRRTGSRRLKSLLVQDSRGPLSYTVVPRSPSLEEVMFVACMFEKWSQFVECLSRLPSLKQVTLNAITMANWTDPAPQFTNPNTKVLRLSMLDIPKAQLIQLLGSFPNLQELRLIQVLAVDDGVILGLTRLLPQLRKLSVVHCSNTADSLVYLKDSKPSLELMKVLTISYCPVQHEIAQRSGGETGRIGWGAYIIIKFCDGFRFLETLFQ